MTRTRHIACLITYIIFAAAAQGQQNVTGGSVNGLVQDENGAVIVGASVTITNIKTNRARVFASTDTGEFRFSYVPVGEYSLRIESNGFEPLERRLTVSVGQAVELKLVMKVHVIVDVIDVEADAAIETTRSRIAETVLPKSIASLPLNGRNFLDLALLLPAVSRTNTGNVQRFAETSAVPGTSISIAGQRNLNTSFIVDGSSANDDSVELAGTFYSQEVIREFQVITNGAGAEYGRASSGFVNIITNSGTNDFRGDVYGFFRNQRFDARNPLAARRDPLTQVQYGGTLDGPIRRDRSFFFANFEQTRRNDSNIITIAPANVVAINARLGAVGFGGPRIETGLVPGGYDTTNFFARIDHKLNGRNDLAVTYNFYDIDAINARTVGGLNAVSRGTNLGNTDNTVNLQNVTSLNPQAVNEFRFQFRRSRLAAPPIDLTGPAVNISGIASFGTATSSPTERDIDLYQLSDSVSLSGHTHTAKAGVEFIYNDLDIAFPGAMQGVYSFNNLASFLSGNYSQFQQAFGAASQKQGNPNVGLFGQDQWRPRRDLTINLGLRYDLQLLPDPIRTDRDNVSPRIGFAYSPDQKTVIRGSFGIYYDRIPTRATSNALQRDGTKYIVVQLSPTAAGAPVFPNVLAVPPSVLITKPNITRIDPNIQNSASYQASVQVEREIARSTTVSLGYMHLRSLHLILSRNVNVPRCTPAVDPNLCRPDPNFGNISRYEGSGDSDYDAMVVSMNRRQGRHADFRVSYTLSKATDDAGNFFFFTPQDNFNLRGEQGLSDNDQRHRLTFSGTLNIPHTGNDVVNRLIGSTDLSTIVTYASRLPFNIVTGGDRNGDTNNNDRPVGVGRNAGRGFDFFSVDLRLARRIGLSEKFSLEILAEAFNLLNRSNFAVPNNVFGNGSVPPAAFGRPTVAFDPRQVQLGMRLRF